MAFWFFPSYCPGLWAGAGRHLKGDWGTRRLFTNRFTALGADIPSGLRTESPDESVFVFELQNELEF